MDDAMLNPNLDLNPYLTLGLQRNPFVAEAEPGVSVELWFDRGWSNPPASRAKQLLQVMGPMGAGKTSHLKHWQTQTGGSYCPYPLGWGRLKLPAVEPIVYWDEANRIPTPFLIVAFVWAAPHPGYDRCSHSCRLRTNGSFTGSEREDNSSSPFRC